MTYVALSLLACGYAPAYAVYIYIYICAKPLKIIPYALPYALVALRDSLGGACPAHMPRGPVEGNPPEQKLFTFGYAVDMPQRLKTRGALN